MILQSLASYYDTLAASGKIARPGWDIAKISYALSLGEEGELLAVLPLKTPELRGKKEVMESRKMVLPAPVKHTVNQASNFLWGRSTYLLGVDGGDPRRAEQCFQIAKELHLSLLSEVDDPFAAAICAFFERWNPADAAESPLLSEIMGDLKKGDNLTFFYADGFAGDNAKLADAWQRAYDGEVDGETMRCLVTGQLVVPAKTHPSVKNVSGAQSSGAALVSFNAPAYESYNRQQNINAPVGKSAAFAYTAALNHLLSARDGAARSSLRIGSSTVVYWAEDGSPAYQSAFSAFLDGAENTVSSSDLSAIMAAVAQGKAMDWDSVPLNPDNKFFILGLAPNAARLSVRFFLRDTFASFVSHIRAHYTRLEIVRPSSDRFETIPLWRLLFCTIREDSTKSFQDNLKKVIPQMSGDTLRAILTGGLYPATLYQQVQLRIRADRVINRERAAIIKAYLLRNTNNAKYREALMVELNENTTYQPYLLGRLFAILELVQERANTGIQTTIRDKYFSSACATPAVVFPVLLNLAQKHLRKIEGYYFESQLTRLMGLITESYPPHHTLYEQGIFQLGYYHQTQKRYEKKEKTDIIEEEK